MATSSTNVWTSSVRSLAQLQSIQFIRASNVVISVHGARPNIKLNIFFDGTLVNHLCGPITNTDTVLVGTNPVLASTPIGVVTSNSNGEAFLLLKIPANTFNTGDKTVVVSEVTDLSLLAIAGTMYGSATAKYTTKGTLEVYQRVTTTHYDTTTVVDEVVTVPFRRDPLAQSFFTYGVKGGIFLTAIEVFFLSKDTTLPIRCEIRGMNQGLPLELNQANPDLVTTLVPSQVNTCTVAQLAAGTAQGTKFRFNPPVYLKEDADYCFVLFTNSKAYHVFTSKLGEKSYETGFNIMEQPFAGSMFKSENNYTWTPEQTEDIKFNIYKAAFDVGSGIVRFVADQAMQTVSGTNFYTTNASTTIIYTSKTMHGLRSGDKITIGADAGTNAQGVYNGIPAAELTGDFFVGTIIDDYKFTFTIAVPATATGVIETGGFLNNLVVSNSGSGYLTTPTITVSGTATATVTSMVDGKIASVSFTQGSGYTAIPTITVSGAGGAELKPTIEAVFNVALNAVYSLVSPQIQTMEIASSRISAEMSTMLGESYTSGEGKQFNPSEYVIFDKQRRLANRANETYRYGSNDSLFANVTMTTDNANVSPIIDMRLHPKLLLGSYAINNQTLTETITSTNPSGTLTLGSSSITNLIGGSGYSVAPLIEIIPAANDLTGTGATATCTISSGTVNTVTVTNIGTGYTQIPSIVFVAPPSGITATAQVILNPFNSEVGGAAGINGTARSRYLTKKITLTTISTNIRVYSQIDSSTETSVDVYIRTSLTGNNSKHTDSIWQILSCDTLRNKSGVRGSFYEYEFNKYGIDPFDVYDLKFVMSSSNPARAPAIGNYRVIVSA